MYKKNKKCNFKIIVFSSILLCLVGAGIFIQKNVKVPSLFFKDAILTVDKFISRPFSSFRKDYDDIIAENDMLKSEVADVDNIKSENDELKDEIKRLKDVLNLNNLVSDREYVNASVVGRDFDFWNDKLLIDKGSNNGISNNMAVVSSGGLVGITDDVSHFNSSVTLLSNFKFSFNISVKVKVNGSEVYGILNKYKDGFFEIMGIVDNIDIPKGSVVVTSGYGNIFPSGILVGYVDNVTTDNFDLSKIVKVRPKVNFDDISYVTVVKRDDK